MKLNDLFEDVVPTQSPLGGPTVYKGKQALEVMAQLEGKKFSVLYSEEALWYINDIPATVTVEQFKQLVKKSFDSRAYETITDMALYTPMSVQEYMQFTKRYNTDPCTFVENWKTQIRDDVNWVDEAQQDDFEDA